MNIATTFQDPPPLALWEKDNEIQQYLAGKLQELERTRPQNERKSPEELMGIRGEIDRLREQIITCWKPLSSREQELEAADAIVGFGFGFVRRKGIAGQVHDWFNQQLRVLGVPENRLIPEQYHPRFYHPGKSNDEIAEIIARLVPGKTVYGQWEVVESLRLKHGVCIADEQAAIPDASYLGTGSVVTQLLQAGLARHQAIIVVSHPDHVRRCMAAVDSIVNEERAREGLPAAKVLVPDTRSVPFDPESVQHWTRSEAAFRPHEARSRALAVYGGHMKAVHFTW